MKTLKLKENFYWAGILDKDLRVFDIIMHTEFGTTYNSYVLNCGGKTILFETAKAKFTKDYEDAIAEVVGKTEIDYVVVNHTEPDHAGSLATIVEKYPNVTVLATPTALAFLKEIVNGDFNSIAVKNNQEIAIGDKTLRFYNLPNLHWPDSMYTYIVEDKTLVTCDSFGSHYAHEGILKSSVTDEEGYMRATKYYFDNILGPFANPFMTNALKVVDSLEIDMICPGHGPVLDTDLDKLIATYKEWCTPAPKNEKLTVAIPFVSAYGYTGEMAEEIAKGIRESGDINVTTYDLVTENYDEVVGAVIGANGVLFGTPTILQDALTPIWNLTISIFPVHCMGKLAGAFGSYGWSGEGVPNITERLKQLKYDVVDGLKLRFKPSDKQLVSCYEHGYQFGVKLQEKAGIKIDADVKKKPRRLVKCLVCGDIFDSSIEVCPVCGVGPENFVGVDEKIVDFRKDTTENFIILGGGTAGLNGARAIRERNQTASITLISEEAYLPYDRPMLTKKMFGQNDAETLQSVAKEWYSENNITVKLSTKVEKLDTKNQTITLVGGESIAYDKCIYALGATGFIPPIKGKDLEGVTAIRTIEDIKEINEWAKTAKSAVVIGGGVLGLEAAWSLRTQKLNVTVLEGAPVLMAGRIDATSVDMLTNIADDKGIRIVTGAKIEEIAGDTKAKEVVLAGGEKIPADIVIISTGVRANIALAQESGIACDRAVIVDANMKTNVENVYACGDCAEFEKANITIWPVAIGMGYTAGANACGDSDEIYVPEIGGLTFHGMGTALFAIGDPASQSDKTYKTIEIKDDKQHTLEKYFFYNGMLCGAILLGNTSNMGKVTANMQKKVNLAEFI